VTVARYEMLYPISDGAAPPAGCPCVYRVARRSAAVPSRPPRSGGLLWTAPADCPFPTARRCGMLESSCATPGGAAA